MMVVATSLRLWAKVFAQPSFGKLGRTGLGEADRAGREVLQLRNVLID